MSITGILSSLKNTNLINSKITQPNSENYGIWLYPSPCQAEISIDVT